MERTATEEKRKKTKKLEKLKEKSSPDFPI